MFAPVPGMRLLLLSILFLTFTSESLAGVPSVQEVQEEAVRYLGFDRDQMDDFLRKSRWSAALPQLQAGFQRDLKDVIRLTTQDSVSITGGNVLIGPDKVDFDQNFDEGTRFEVKAVWSLDELVFNRNSLAASAELRDWVRERNRVLQEVTEAYFTRKRMLREVQSRTDPIMLRERKNLLLDQATGTLDAYTGGWFSQRLGEGEMP